MIGQRSEVSGQRSAGQRRILSPALCLLISVLCPLTSGFADTRYVWTNSPYPGAPYNDWTNAAHDIQSAIDASGVGDTVLVTNGVYDAGGRAVVGTMTNRIAITNGISVLSVNGPSNTAIVGKAGPGSGYTNGAIRCAYVASNAALVGFTLTNGYTQGTLITSSGCGGGAYCETNGVVSNCFITSCHAGGNGGGGCNGLFFNCTFRSNVAGNGGAGLYNARATDCFFAHNDAVNMGGGTYLGSVLRCQVVSNEAGVGGGTCDSGAQQCLLAWNLARMAGGARGGSLSNCVVMKNVADTTDGGGTYDSALYNCTVIGNSAMGRGGGVGSSSLSPMYFNSVVYYNTAASEGDNHYNARSMHFCCAAPKPDGEGNLADEPGVLGQDNPYLVSNAPCINRGNNSYAAGSSDFEGDARIIGGTVDIGSDEFSSGSTTGAISVAISAEYTNACAGLPIEFTARIGGRAGGFAWNWGDKSGDTNRLQPEHAFASNGVYSVVLSAWNPGAYAAATQRVTILPVSTNYVALGGVPAYPFTNWTTAATTLQAAVDAAVPGGRILVAAGRYEGGAWTSGVAGDWTRNRVGLYKPVCMMATNPDPAATVINGKGTNTDNSRARCAYLVRHARLSGFTLTNGFAYSGGLGSCGGGARCEDGAVISNCLIRNCVSVLLGGGAYKGTLVQCVLTNNTSDRGGGMCLGDLRDCVIANNVSSNKGGGLYEGSATNCILSGNRAYASGGGASRSTLHNCLVVTNYAAAEGGGADCWNGGSLRGCLVHGNQAARVGGGVYYGSVENCTIAGNIAEDTAHDANGGGGGVYNSWVYSSIVISNTAYTTNDNYTQGWKLSYSCTRPGTGQPGCTTNDPQFLAPASGDFRLSPSSPCVDKGINQSWMLEATDLDGNHRVINGVVDMGAYETPFFLTARVWLQGPYSTNVGAMTADLTGALPLTAPYSADPRIVTAIPSNTTDWVLLQIREPTGGVAKVSRSVFLRDDGYLVSDKGTNAVSLDISRGDYHVVIQHRNHLAAMSASALPYTNTLVTYDFTTNYAQFYGGTNGCVQIDSNTWGMIAGDADGDGKITAVDQAICAAQTNETGYKAGDFNLDGIVNNE